MVGAILTKKLLSRTPILTTLSQHLVDKIEKFSAEYNRIKK